MRETGAVSHAGPGDRNPALRGHQKGNGHLWGCKLTFDMNGLARIDLYDGVEDVISAADFIELSEGAQVIFV